MVTKVTLHSIEVFRDHFDYDRATARLVWRKHPKYPRRNGLCAECGHKSGYRRVTLHGRTFYAHRVIFALFNGDVPDCFHVDHINGNISDNRIENLRLATNSQNMANCGKYSTNTSGHKGVSWQRKESKWRAGVSTKGKFISSGYFDNIEDASAAYRAKAKEIFGEFARS